MCLYFFSVSNLAKWPLKIGTRCPFWRSVFVFVCVSGWWRWMEWVFWEAVRMSWRRCWTRTLPTSLFYASWQKKSLLCHLRQTSALSDHQDIHTYNVNQLNTWNYVDIHSCLSADASYTLISWHIIQLNIMRSKEIYRVNPTL